MLEDDTVEDIEFVYVDALVETKEGTVIYDGVLVDYDLSKDSGLDFITINEAQRRFLKDDPLRGVDGKTVNAKDPYYSVPGHLFVIPFNKVLNLNVTFYKFVELENGEYDVVMVS